MEVEPCGNNVLWKECLVCFERMEKKSYAKTLGESLFISYVYFMYEFSQHNAVIENKTYD